MNSSLTQLIAEPAADLAAASSPRDPAAGLWKRDSIWVLSPFPPPAQGARVCPRTDELMASGLLGYRSFVKSPALSVLLWRAHKKQRRNDR